MAIYVFTFQLSDWHISLASQTFKDVCTIDVSETVDWLSHMTSRTVVLLESFVDEHGGHIFQLRADPECVAESAGRDTQYTPSLGVKWRQTTKLAVSLARFARVQVVTSLQDARVLSGRRWRLSRWRIDDTFLTFCTNTAVVVLSLCRYPLPQQVCFNNTKN